jgi:hypothetical protein
MISFSKILMGDHLPWSDTYELSALRRYRWVIISRGVIPIVGQLIKKNTYG